MEKWIFEGNDENGYSVKCPICGKIYIVPTIDDVPCECKICKEQLKLKDSYRTMDLIDLIKQYPDLPVVPLVYGSNIDHDYAYTMLEWGDCKKGEYACYNERFFDDREDFKEYYYDINDDYLCDKFNYNPRICFENVKKLCTSEEVAINNENENKLETYLNNIADNYFKDAIIIYIG